MALTFVSTEYSGAQNSVSWEGIRMIEGESFSNFLKTHVADRLNDNEGRTDFSEHLRGLSLTEMGKESLESVLNAEVTEERDWAIGEALAEAFLIQHHGLVLPWNMERDKRNMNGSLPGADIIGFMMQGTDYYIALGEVKSSTEISYPPQVMSGRSEHMGGQIEDLARDLSKINQILKWLFYRVKGTEYQEYYDSSLRNYFDSGNKAAILYGVLIRDVPPNRLDLFRRGNVLSNSLTNLTLCRLFALYLPCLISSLPTIIISTESAS